MAEGLTGLRVGNYKAGFWHLAFEKNYTGFCSDVKNMNPEDDVDKERCDIAWRVEISRLHKKWVAGDGQNCTPASGLTDADLFSFLAKPQAAAEPTPEALMREHQLFI
ncbi:hypothetical protein LZ554_006908 [Drepanopeziza brunnea f. sp. 'monogermtubi']|nr:hypothetical protein LZ554_006908 [Drepanopeziza brunnea f. sp. 'monogermtubi']